MTQQMQPLTQCAGACALHCRRIMCHKYLTAAQDGEPETSTGAAEGLCTRPCSCTRRLEAIVGLLRERLPGTHVLIVAVLPRGFAGPDDYSWPNKFTKVCRA